MYYQQSIKKIAEEFKTNLTEGLSSKEASIRLSKYGQNSFPEQKAESIFTTIGHQLQSPLIYVLFIAALITIYLNQWFDTSIILFVVLVNTIIGTLQEGRTKKIIASLQKMIHTDSIVLRDGKQHVISDSQLVPGDIIIIQAGMRIPADARVVESRDLQIDESILTGESTPSSKKSHPLAEKKRLYEQENMIFQGTYAISGNATALIIATGTHTEIGKLHKTINSISTDFPLKEDLNRVAQLILFIVLFCIVILFGIGYWLKIELYDLLMTLTAIFVSAIPEGLPVIVTFVLARGAYAMAKKEFLIKNLQAVEVLGRTNIILTDKTGTLTRNEIMVVEAYVNGKWYTITGNGYDPRGQVLHEGNPINEEDCECLKKLAYSTLINKTQLYYDKQLKTYRVKGNQTEAAMTIFTKKLGLDQEKMLKHCKLLYEQPFDKEKRYNFGCYAYNGQIRCYMTGSPEVILKQAENNTKKNFEALDKMLKKGLRVIGIATLELPINAAPEHTDGFSDFINKHFNDIKFAGLFGMQDAIRPDVKKSVEEAHKLGIKIAMVTGDHKETALHIAKQVSIYHDGERAITGEQFMEMTEAERIENTKNTTIYARFVPQEKYELINTYHKISDIVAMTGDGVNDAPSLAAADIGIAMGIMGTEVAKQAADAILLNDSFTSIVDGVYEGRNVFYTLRRIILYYLTTNTSELLIIMIILFLGLPLPLLATQILWMNIVTDGFMDFALAFEPANHEQLQHNATFKKKLIDLNFITKMIITAIPMIIGSVTIFFYSLPSGTIYARTMTLTTMILFQWFNAWNCRSESLSILKIGILRNKVLVAATSILVTMQISITYIPFLAHIFNLKSINFQDWVICIMVASSIIIVEEIRKLLNSLVR